METYRDKDGNTVYHHRFGNTPGYTAKELIRSYGDPNDINTAGLSKYNTASLVEELKNRSQVETLHAALNQAYEVNTFARVIQEEGPVIILVVRD